MTADRLEIRLFGGVRFSRGGDPLTDFVSRKAEALLAYLACAGRPVPREVAAGLLWGELEQRRALANLSVALSSLRKSVADYLRTDRHTLAFDDGAPFFLDVAAFEEALEDARRRQASAPRAGLGRTTAAALERAVDLYSGEFLAGFALRDAPEFEAWALLEQERYRRLALEALADLVDFHLQRGEHAAGIGRALRLLALDPLDEAAHRRLMQLLALAGKRTQALAHFEACARTLDEELGVTPEVETATLAEAIEAGRFPAERERPSSTATRSDREPGPAHNLSSATTSFVGREEEMAAVDGWLARPAERLLTVVGPGGVGKTRLALEAARAHVGAFLDGVWHVSLVPLQAPEAIPTAVAQAIGLSFSGSDDPRAQLLRYLREREMLLVLDNAEHLLADPTLELITSILSDAPHVHLLVTSRERLRLQAETLLPLRGLPFPEAGAAADGIERFAAVRLFVERAHRLRRSFALTGANRAAVARLCRLVGGTPLALELAASWIQALEVGEIVAELEAGPGLLATDQRDVPARHRSLRAVFDASWERLPPAEQDAYRCLSLFRGGFTREAAATVAGASLLTLAALIDKSFLRRDDDGRFRRHPLLLQFAGERLAAIPAEHEEVAAAHAAFFADLLAAHEPALHGPQVDEALAHLVPELENVGAAWRWAVAHGRRPLVRRMAGGLARVMRLRSLYRQGLTLFDEALARLPAGEEDGEDGALRPTLLVQRGEFEYYLSHFDRAWATFTEAREEVEGSKTTPGGAAGLRAAIDHYLGIIADTRGDYEAARSFFETALQWAHEAGDAHRESRILNSLGIVAWGEGEYETAEATIRESLALAEEMGDEAAMAHRLLNLGWVSNVQGAFERGRDFSRRSRNIFRTLGDRGGLADSLYSLGVAVNGLGRHEEALALEEEALAMQREIGSRYGIAVCLAALGEIYLQSDDLEEAERYLLEALREALAIDVDSVTVPLLVDVGDLYSRRERPDEAAALISFALGHPAMLDYYRVQGEERLATLEEELGAERFAAAVEGSKQYALEDVVATIVG